MDYNYILFVKQIAESLPTYLPKDVEIKAKLIEKLHKESYFGLMITNSEKSKLSLGYDLRPEYDECNGEVTEAILEKISNEIEHELEYAPTGQLITDLIHDFSYVREHVFLDLISVKGHEEMLKNFIHDIHEDLAAVYKISLSSEGVSIAVRKEMLDLYNISEAEFKDEVRRNSFETASFIIAKADVLFPELRFLKERSCYVVTNLEDYFGAGCIFYPHTLAAAREMVGGNFFILPSSVHEMVLLKDNGNINIQAIKTYHIQGINMVPSDECLSESIYYVDGSLNFKKVA